MARFEERECQQVTVKDGTIFFHYAGTGQPLLLLHGVPQSSLMFLTIAPLLASNGFLVIVPDMPGMGQSIRSKSIPLTSKNAADALYTVIKFLGLEHIHILAFDKGCAPAVLLSRDHPSLVKCLVVSEYALPGFGHEFVQQPREGTTLFDNWHLGIFTVPEAAVFLIRGREEQFLGWYFWHASYSGMNAIRGEHFTQYVREWQRPGALEAAIEFLGGSVWADMEEFKSFTAGTRISAKMLAMGGEASLGKEGLSEMFWGAISASPLETVLVPKAGHWLGDENPQWVAKHLATWIGQSGLRAIPLELSWLDGDNSGRKRGNCCGRQEIGLDQIVLMYTDRILLDQ